MQKLINFSELSRYIKTKKMKTNRQIIRVSSNKRNRTYTIYESGLKFRTNPMTKEEFNSESYNTINDWKAFLRYSQDYYQVK